MPPSRLARTRFTAAVAGLAASLACAPKAPDDRSSVDLIIYGGPIYTGVEAAPNVEAVAVKDGRIARIGASAQIERLAGDTTRRIDLKGAALYPGFTDSHGHLLGIGMRELTLNLEGVGSIEELVEIVAAEVAESKAGETIYGRGWIETGWPEGRFPSRDDLDPVSPENPVALVRVDGHALVANSAALARAGVDGTTADPEGGRIERDAAGRPTGMLIDAAMRPVAALIETPNAAQKERAYLIGAALYAEKGWTGVHNMSVERDDVAMIERLAAQADDGIPIRVYNALDRDGFDWLLEHAPRTDATGRVVTRAVKLYMDGALGSRGAALFEPYADQPQTSGLLRLQRDAALSVLRRAQEGGVQVAIHAIGDRGNRLALDWCGETLAARGPNWRSLPSPRWRIEHAQILDPEDIPRFAQLAIIASMQPSHAITDLYFAPARLGQDRLAGAYAWKSLLDAGAVVAGGSDAPVERGDPLIEFYAAAARRSLDGFQGPDWKPEQAVGRAQALRMFTLAPAYASFQEADLGTIEPGKKADFTAFSRDIMAVPEAEILSARTVLTIVEGKIIYSALRP